MTPREDPDAPVDDGTPTVQETLHDFTVPADADLRPVDDEEAEA